MIEVCPQRVLGVPSTAPAHVFGFLFFFFFYQSGKFSHGLLWFLSEGFCITIIGGHQVCALQRLVSEEIVSLLEEKWSVDHRSKHQSSYWSSHALHFLRCGELPNFRSATHCIFPFYQTNNCVDFASYCLEICFLFLCMLWCHVRTC
jgi:hypothetical protein